MGRSSLHVSDATRRRLAKYKPTDMSFDQLLNVFMNGVAPEEFKARWQKATRDAAKAAMTSRRAPTPAEGMETAFRLFELGRGLG